MSAKTEILRPNGIGNYNQIEHEAGSVAPYHWQNVDEVVADNASTMVYDDDSVRYDTYALTSPQLTGEIEKIVLHGKFMMDVDSDNLLAGKEPEWRLYTGTPRSYLVCNRTSPPQFKAGVWTFRQSDYRYDLSLNPQNLLPWTKADLDSLQLGCGLARCRFVSFEKEYCTQLWVVVHYMLPAGQIWIEGTGGQGGYLWIEGAGSGSGHLWIE